MYDINIALATNDNYAIGCGVVIHSALKNLKKSVHATIHILYSDLNTDSKTRIERIARQHGSGLRWHCIDHKTLDSFGNLKIPRYYTKEAFFRLLLREQRILDYSQPIGAFEISHIGCLLCMGRPDTK